MQSHVWPEINEFPFRAPQWCVMNLQALANRCSTEYWLVPQLCRRIRTRLRAKPIGQRDKFHGDETSYPANRTMPLIHLKCHLR
jgi:hypothetical protein